MSSKFSDKENETIDILQKKLEMICYSYKEKNIQIKKLKEIGFQQTTEIPSYMIMPSSKFKRIWDFIIYFFTSYSLFFIPIDASFNKDCFLDDITILLVKNLDMAMVIFFAFDIFIKFLMPVMNLKGELSTNLEEIATTYIKSDFIFDVLSAMPFNLLVATDITKCGTQTQNSAKIFLYFGLIRINRILNLSHLIEKSDTKHINVFRLIKLLLFFFYVCHFIGCVKVGVTSLTVSVSQFLLRESKKDFENFMKIYSYCLLVGISSILGTDQHLETSSEKLLNVIINVFSLGISANIFGYIALILEKMSSSKVSTNKNLRDKLDLVNEYLFYENVDGKLRDKVNNLYKFMYIRQRRLFFHNFMYSDVNESLLPFIKLQLWDEIYFIRDKLFVLDTISPYFFSNMLFHMEGRLYVKDEIIILEGENSLDLYFICCSSMVEVYCSDNLVNKMKEGEFFGESAVFTSSKKRSATIISKSDGDFLYVKGNIFYKLLLDFPDEREIFYNYAKRYLTLYNQIISPDSFSKFITNKDKIYSSIIHQNLYVLPEDQNNKLIYDRKLLDGNEKGIVYDFMEILNVVDYIK
jgi:hypothetical protein